MYRKMSLNRRKKKKIVFDLNGHTQDIIHARITNNKLFPILHFLLTGGHMESFSTRYSPLVSNIRNTPCIQARGARTLLLNVR